MKILSCKLKYIVTLVFIYFFFNSSAEEKKWFIYPNLGFDMGGAIPWPLSNIPEQYNGTPKILPNAGLGFAYNLAERWELDIELSYHNLSFSANAYVVSLPFYFNNQQSVQYFTGDTKTDVELRFIEFPVVINYQLSKNWQLAFGPYFSYIVEGTFKSEGINGWMSDNKEDTDNVSGDPPVSLIPMDFSSYLDNYDLGVFLGYKYKVAKKLYFWGRFHTGFKSIFVEEFDNLDYEMYQVRLSFGLSYKLFPGNGDNND